MEKEKKSRFAGLPEYRGADIGIFNDALRDCRDFGSVRILRWNERFPSSVRKGEALIKACSTDVKLVYRDASGAHALIFMLDGTDYDSRIGIGLKAFREINRTYRIPRGITLPAEARDYVETAMQFANPAFSGKRTPGCVGYDVNSAYSAAMLRDMPDTSMPCRTDGIVGEGEIGLYMTSDWADGKPHMAIAEEGDRAHYIYPRIPSPFKPFVGKWYGLKKAAPKGSKDRARAKLMLNCVIGYFGRNDDGEFPINPVLRTFILAYANTFIDEAWDPETSIYCNTDSIVSSVVRDDIEVGDGLGQFKIEHEGSFACKGMTYQWNLEAPSYRSKAKAWFRAFEERNGRPWELLRDDPPGTDFNEYEFDAEKLIIRRK